MLALQRLHVLVVAVVDEDESLAGVESGLNGPQLPAFCGCGQIGFDPGDFFAAFARCGFQTASRRLSNFMPDRSVAGSLVRASWGCITWLRACQDSETNT